MADAKEKERYNIFLLIFQNQLKKLNIKNSENENRLHFYLSVNHRIRDNKINLIELKNYFEKLVKANSKTKIFNEISLKKVLGKKWIWYIYYKKDIKAIFSKYFIYGLMGLKK
jgi:hypothetical protein